jgi:flagellar basal-body rod modification protein FlgD
MASQTSALTLSSTTGAASADNSTKQSVSSAIDPLAQKETFLKLLVAQIRNQNPLNPADGVEFLTQLAQFSQLEQMFEIRSELETIRKALVPETTDSASSASQAQESQAGA